MEWLTFQFKQVTSKEIGTHMAGGTIDPPAICVESSQMTFPDRS